MGSDPCTPTRAHSAVQAESEKGCVLRTAGALQVEAEWEERQNQTLAAWAPVEAPGQHGGVGGCCFSASCSQFSSRTENLEVTGEISLPFISTWTWKFSVWGRGVGG